MRARRDSLPDAAASEATSGRQCSGARLHPLRHRKRDGRISALPGARRSRVPVRSFERGERFEERLAEDVEVSWQDAVIDVASTQIVRVTLVRRMPIFG